MSDIKQKKMDDVDFKIASDVNTQALNFKGDEAFKRFFSRTQTLSIILRGIISELKDYEPKEIETYIEVEFVGKDSRVEFDSMAKM